MLCFIVTVVQALRSQKRFLKTEVRARCGGDWCGIISRRLNLKVVLQSFQKVFKQYYFCSVHLIA